MHELLTFCRSVVDLGLHSASYLGSESSEWDLDGVITGLC
jgi:hypothetical protein